MYTNYEGKEFITLQEFFESKKELSIKVDNKEQAEFLCNEFHKLGKKWRAGDNYKDVTYYGLNIHKTYTNDGYYNDCVNKAYHISQILFDNPKPKKVFDKDAYLKDAWPWVLECQGKTAEEVEEMGYSISKDWFVDEDNK